MNFDYISEIWFDFNSLQLRWVKKKRLHCLVSFVIAFHCFHFLIPSIFTLSLKHSCLYFIFCSSLFQHTLSFSFYNTIYCIFFLLLSWFLFFLQNLTLASPFKTSSPLTVSLCSLPSLTSKLFLPAVLKFWGSP